MLRKLAKTFEYSSFAETNAVGEGTDTLSSLEGLKGVIQIYERDCSKGD